MQTQNEACSICILISTMSGSSFDLCSLVGFTCNFRLQFAAYDLLIVFLLVTKG